MHFNPKLDMHIKKSIFMMNLLRTLTNKIVYTKQILFLCCSKRRYLKINVTSPFYIFTVIVLKSFSRWYLDLTNISAVLNCHVGLKILLLKLPEGIVSCLLIDSSPVLLACRTLSAFVSKTIFKQINAMSILILHLLQCSFYCPLFHSLSVVHCILMDSITMFEVKYFKNCKAKVHCLFEAVDD